MKSDTLNAVAQIATSFLSFLNARKANKKKQKARNVVRNSGSK